MTFLIFSVGIVMGIGFGFMYCPAIVIVTMYFEKYRSLATGVTVCGAGVGTFVFSQIIGFLIIRFDWQIVFLIYAGLFVFFNLKNKFLFLLRNGSIVCTLWYII